jgi:hypothetical protein
VTRPADRSEALFARQAERQEAALAVLADLDLLARLGEIGRPVVTGSLALGLMVRPDIDVTTLCPTLDPGPIFDAVRPLVLHPRVHRLAFRNDTGRWNTDPDYPDGLYWTVRYRSDDGEDWNLDLWFLPAGTTQFDLQHLEALPPRLTPETRVAILDIKEAWRDRASYGATVRGYDVYAAVLDHGIRTPDAFAAHLRERART